MAGLLPDKKVGIWRLGPIYIVDEIDGEEIVQYTGPDTDYLPKLISSFLKWVSIQHKKQHYHPVLLAGLIHYIFVSIDDRMEADLTEFIDFFTKGFLQSVKSVSHYIQAGRVMEDSGKPLRLNQDELQILDYVYEFGSINVNEAISILSATKRTTQRRLIGLVKNNILQVNGRGPATKYLLISKLD
ncbi:hypothetical protein KKA13_04845 [Patescibacteria group bacterium]|nr:hypothetical protein [Patescibacteria group bacterium]MBU0974147.1 hypothetical protein [Patescibacteria group bacterium]